MPALPFSAFQYSSCLEFFQDAYAFHHASDESFSYEKISETCGFKSRTEARNLIKGIKPLTENLLGSLAEGFGLAENEKNYLLCLREFQDASAGPGVYDLFSRLIALQKQNVVGASPFREIEIATSVLHMTLLSVIDLPEVPQAPMEIATILKGRYSAEEITLALNELESHGFLRRHEVSERWVSCQKHIKKYDHNPNYFLRSFHQQCLTVSRDALERETPEERYLVGASFAVNHKVFPRIVQKMNAFVEKLMQLEGVAGTPDTVVQINQQLIKMTAIGPAPIGRGLGREAAERGSENTENTVIAQRG